MILLSHFTKRLMEPEIRVGDNMLDAIEVKNGLRQGCTMVPTLFSFYSCVVIEEWLEKVKNVEGAGTHILYRLDKQLFRRSTKGACIECFRECQFADDVALLATTREAAETVTQLYQSAARTLDLP